MRPGVLVVAKSPVAGEAKTRLGAQIGMRPAADLASAALLDTLAAGEEAFPPGRRTLALTGELARGERAAELSRRLTGWAVFRQRGKGLGQRLANAHVDAARLLQAPVVQIGMDTPQVSARLLGQVATQVASGRVDAVLAPARDGGWWCLALDDPRWARGLDRVTMSTPDTGRATYAMLRHAGARVTGSDLLTDVDSMEDAVTVAQQTAGSRFALAWQRLLTDTRAPTDLFDEALAGAPCLMHGMPGGPIELPVGAWQAPCNRDDLLLVGACTGPTLDVGCGPGRLTHGLAVQGTAALGIDVAAGAVRQTLARGAQAIRRDVFDAVPGEGRWDSVLLADGNIGIGGDPVRLLRRVESLLAPTGRLVVEVDPPGVGVSTHRVHLEVAGRRSSTFSWGVVGAESLDELARQASMRMLWVVNQRGRWFAQLERRGDRRCPA